MSASEVPRPCGDLLCPVAIKNTLHLQHAAVTAQLFKEEHRIDDMHDRIKLGRLAADSPLVPDSLKDQLETQAILQQRDLTKLELELAKQQRPLYDLDRVRGACLEGSYTEDREGDCFRFCGSLAINEDERECDSLPEIYSV